MKRQIYRVKSPPDDYFQHTIGERKQGKLIRSGEIIHGRAGARILLRRDVLEQYVARQKRPVPARPSRLGPVKGPDQHSGQNQTHPQEVEA